MHKMTANACRLLIVTLLCSIIAYSPAPASAAHAGDGADRVLIVYDGQAREGNLELLQRLLSAYGAQVFLISNDRYQPGDMHSFSKVIALRNVSGTEHDHTNFIRDLHSYTGHYMHIGSNLPAVVQKQLQATTEPIYRRTVQIHSGSLSQTIRVSEMLRIADAAGISQGSVNIAGEDEQSPFGVRLGRFAYVPFLEANNLSGWALAPLLKDWMSITSSGSMYVLFKEIYPFSDLQLLTQLADRLYDAGIPFIASIMPVFYNTDYPAMERYLEALKYVQSRNGSILVNAPVVSTAAIRNDHTLPDKMSEFIDLLAESEIAPLGIGAELYWAYDRQYADDGMAFFDSAALFANADPRHHSPSDVSKPFASSLFTTTLDELLHFENKDKRYASPPIDTAIVFDFSNDPDRVDDIIERLLASWITFADYKFTDHQVQTDANTVESRHGQLYINGEPLNLAGAKKEISSDYVYREEVEQSFTSWFNLQNYILITVILLTFPVFGAFLIIGSRRYRRKYFH